MGKNSPKTIAYHSEWRALDNVGRNQTQRSTIEELVEDYVTSVFTFLRYLRLKFLFCRYLV